MGVLRVKYEGQEYKVLAIDFEGICICKGTPSVIIKKDDGCIPLSDCEIIYPITLPIDVEDFY